MFKTFQRLSVAPKACCCLIWEDCNDECFLILIAGLSPEDLCRITSLGEGIKNINGVVSYKYAISDNLTTHCVDSLWFSSSCLCHHGNQWIERVSKNSGSNQSKITRTEILYLLFTSNAIYVCVCVYFCSTYSCSSWVFVHHAGFLVFFTWMWSLSFSWIFFCRSSSNTLCVW